MAAQLLAPALTGKLAADFRGTLIEPGTRSTTRRGASGTA